MWVCDTAHPPSEIPRRDCFVGSAPVQTIEDQVCRPPTSRRAPVAAGDEEHGLDNPMFAGYSDGWVGGSFNQASSREPIEWKGK